MSKHHPCASATRRKSTRKMSIFKIELQNKDKWRKGREKNLVDDETMGRETEATSPNLDAHLERTSRKRRGEKRARKFPGDRIQPQSPDG